jgi:hypothetical protein
MPPRSALTTDKLRLAADFLRSHADLEDEELVPVLVERGFNLQDAARLVEFLPLAFGRVLLGRMGVALQPTYVRTAADGTTVERRLDSNAAWLDIARFVEHEIADAFSSRDLLVLAARSAEFTP